MLIHGRHQTGVRIEAAPANTRTAPPFVCSGTSAPNGTTTRGHVAGHADERQLKRKRNSSSAGSEASSSREAEDEWLAPVAAGRKRNKCNLGQQRHVARLSKMRPLATSRQDAHRADDDDDDHHHHHQARVLSDNEQESQHEQGARLFVSVQQLCYEVVQQDLLADLADQQALCLFIFGRQGSGKGELCFELTEHSSLASALANDAGQGARAQAPSGLAADSPCPLYHYVDVSALIVANIDERIRQYNKLGAQALRTRTEQLALGAERDEPEGGGAGEADSEQEETSEGLAGDAGRQQCAEHEPSLTSELSSGEPVAGHQDLATGADHFGPVTLSTKQRSILQLKLIKYSNCVTAKWITTLIQRHIDELETRISECWRSVGVGVGVGVGGSNNNNQLSRCKRVYLINLVPNHLTLFKSCLYLQQSLCLRELRYPFWAIKFERRTNIRLLTKERHALEQEAAGSWEAPGAGQQQADSGPAHGSRLSASIRFAHSIRLPMLSVRSPEAEGEPAPGHNREPAAACAGKTGGRQQREDAPPAALLATDLLAAGIADNKLGPRFNEYFAHQFKSLNRLATLRYNPTTNYNYASPDCAPCGQGAAAPGAGRPSCAQTRPARLGSAKLVSSSSMSELDRAPPDGAAGRTHGSSLAPPTDQAAGHPQQWRAAGGSGPRAAVELELYDSSLAPAIANRWRLSPPAPGLQHQAPGSEPPRQQKWPGSPGPPTTACYHTYRPPARSPLVFAAASERATSGAYQLLAIKIGYPNGSCHSVLEARRAHRRHFRLRAPNDAAKLAKLARKACHWLAADLDLWLAAAIGGPGHAHQERPAAGGAPGPSHRRRHSTCACAPASPVPVPSLVVYAIRVELGRARAAGQLELPAWAMGADSSASDDSGAARARPSALRPNGGAPAARARPAAAAKTERHVQFRLCQEPGEGAAPGELARPAQRRIWIDESLFVSCHQPELFGLMRWFADLVARAGERAKPEVEH